MLKKKTILFDVGGSKVIRIPVEVLRDSQYPFMNNDPVIIEIKDGTLIVSRIYKGEKN